jgi:tape measure domain-containing protein
VSKTISNLSVGLFGDVAHFAHSFGTTATNSVKSFAGSLGGLGGKLLEMTGIGAAVGAGLGAIAGLGEGFRLAAEFEQTTVAMEVMLGSADKAKQVLGDLKKFAASTPFQFPELASSAKQLIAFGIDADNIAPTLRMLGDIAAGTGKPVEELADLYGKVKVNGKLSGEEIHQFTSAGIPLTALLAKQLGKTPAAIKDMIEAGQIGFPQVQQAFIAMTSEGGRFNGMMEKQSHTVAGLFSTLKDTLGDTLQRIAETIIDTFNIRGAMAGLISSGEGIGNFFVGLVQKIAPAMKSVGASIIGGFETAYRVVWPIVMDIWEVTTRTFGMIRQAVTPIIMAMAAEVQSAFQSIHDFVAPIVTRIGTFIADNWQTALTATFSFASGVWGVVSAVFGDIWQFVSYVGNGLVSIWVTSWELITGKTWTAGQTMSGVMSGIGSAAKWLGEEITLAFNVAGYAITHWKDGLDIALVEVAASMSGMQDRADYVMQAMVYGVEYVSRNWRTILTDLMNFNLVTFENMSSNVVAIFSNLPGLISGKAKFGDIWKPLTEGFKSSVTEAFKLPDFADSKLTSDLKTAAAGMEAAFGKGLGESIAGKADNAKKAAQGAADWLKKAFGIGSKPITPKIDTGKAPPPFTVKPVVPDGSKVSLAVELKRADVVRFGSAESQLLSHEFAIGMNSPAAPVPTAPAPPPSPNDTRGGNDVAAVVKDTAKSQVEATAKGNDLLFKIWQQQITPQVATFA